jgi:methyl-accepting chemotaxis protein
MVRRARPREQSSSLAVKLWSIALAAGLPGTLVIVMSGSVGPGAAIAGVGVTLGLSGVALAIGLHTLVTTRLRLVAGALRRIAEGDFTRRFGTRGGDDIASVMRTLDEVGGRLQSARRRCRPPSDAIACCTSTARRPCFARGWTGA